MLINFNLLLGVATGLSQICDFGKVVLRCFLRLQAAYRCRHFMEHVRWCFVARVDIRVGPIEVGDVSRVRCRSQYFISSILNLPNICLNYCTGVNLTLFYFSEIAGER